MMLTVSYVVGEISRWPKSLGVTVPPSLRQAMDVYDAIHFVETNYAVPFDLESVTPENAEQAVYEYAAKLASQVALINRHGVGPEPVLEEAKRRAGDDAGRRVMSEAKRAMPDVIDQLRPEFDAAAKVYVAAVEQLPKELTVKAIAVDSTGASAVAYGQAQSAGAYLNSIDRWLGSLEQLGFYSDKLTRIFAPTTPAELDLLARAFEGRASDTLTAVGKLLWAAVTAGIKIELHTPAESNEIRGRIDKLRTGDEKQAHEELAKFATMVLR